MKNGREPASQCTVASGRNSLMTWKELSLDPCFQDLPYKIELNGRGQIVMSPARSFHGFFAFKIGELPKRHLPEGEVIMECAVDTADGTKEADAAWVSRERLAVVQAKYSSSIAPEICAEVMSRSNTREEMMHKRDLYLGAGFTEYWRCQEDGMVEFFDADGSLMKSKMAPIFPSRIAMT